MNKMALICLTALSVYGWSSEEIATANKANGNPPSMKPVHKQQPHAHQAPAVVTLTSARHPSDNNWYIFADALYWHADVDNADWVNKTLNTAITGSPHKNYTLAFKWDWGFRIGIGYNLHYDQWDTDLYYTWFQTSNSQSAGSEAHEILNPETSSIGTFDQGKINWRIHYNMFDWELGRWFYITRALSLRPHIGIKGGWIDQKSLQRYSERFAVGAFKGRVHGEVEDRNDFWGIGLAGGFNTNWRLGHIDQQQFSLFADFAGALMYGHFHVEHEVSSVNVDTGVALVNPGDMKDLDRNLAVPMLQSILGLQWGMPFNTDRNFVTLRAGYEFQIWFRQNQMFNDFDLARFNGTLGLQGITIDLRFDF